MNQIDRLRKLLVRVGEDGPQFYTRDIKKLSDCILETYNDLSQNDKDFLLKTFSECICLQTDNQMIYAVVTCLIDIKMPNLSNSIIDNVLEKLQKQLDLGKQTSSKYLIIYLGELMNVGLINSFQFITLLFDLVNEAEKTIDESQDYYLNIVVGVLPTLVLFFILQYHGLMEKSKIELKSLLQTIKQLIQKRDLKYIQYLGIDNQNYQNNQNNQNNQYLQKDQLSILWKFINDDENLIIEDLPIKFVQQNFQKELKQIKQIRKSKKIYFNSKDKKNCVYYSPDVLLIKQFQNINQIMQFTSLYELLSIFKDNQKILIMKLQEMNRKFNCDFQIFQAIINQMLDYQSNYQLIYKSLIIGLTQEQDLNLGSQIQKHVQSFINYAFYNYQQFDIEIQKRIIDFFSFYLINNGLTNFDFTELNPVNKDQQSFIKSVIQKIDKLLPRKQLIEGYFYFYKEIPEKYQQNLSDQPLFTLYYNDSNSNSYADAEIIMDKINSKLGDSDMMNFLKSSNSQLESSGDELVNIFMECFYLKTKQTLTHLNIILSRYENTLKTLVNKNKETNQINVLNSLQKFWKSNWHLCLYVDKFYEANLLKLQYVLNWIFKLFEKEIDKQNLYELQFCLINQVLNNYLQLQLAKQDYDIQSLKIFFKKFTQLFIDLQEQTEIFKYLFSQFKNLLIRYRNLIKQLLPQIQEDFKVLKSDDFDNFFIILSKMI